MSQKSNAKLIQGDIGKTLYKMALPMLMGIFGMIVMSISMGLGVGASSVISREIGTGNIDQGNRGYKISRDHYDGCRGFEMVQMVILQITLTP